ncbi:MAG: lysophospholipid acyltransferase family protein [Wenzhouxiangellaceae bacterium]|nr:lysophospholipid acyltransferase family protein [Wenzhouxiangellaceae bacterium]
MSNSYELQSDCTGNDRPWLYPLWQWGVLIPLVVLITLVAATLAVLLSLFGFKRAANLGVAASWARSIAWLTPMRVDITGADRIVPGTRYVVVANHQSQYDIPLVYGFSGLDLRWVMKAELGKIPFIAQGCRAIGHIFIDRGQPDAARDTIRRAVSRLGPGTGVMFFAEGTRSRTGRLLKFRKGAFQVAVEQGMPVLPVSLVGTRRILKPGSVRVHPGRVRLVFHEPIMPPDAPTEQAVSTLCVKTRAAIASALDESQCKG